MITGIQRACMKEDTLIISAQSLKKPSEESKMIFSDKMDDIADSLICICLPNPDIKRRISEDNTSIMENNFRNYLRFMGTIFHRIDPEMLVQTSLWAFTIYHSQGLDEDFWKENRNTLVKILKKELPNTVYNEIFPFFEWFMGNIPSFEKIIKAREKKGITPNRY